MHKGEVAKFMLQPEFGYGEEGSPPKIPPNAALVFTVELISWVEKDDLFGDGTVVKSLIEEGTGFDKPKKRGEVRISFKVTAADGTVTKEGSGCDYAIGSGEYGPLSKVVDKAILGMRSGEKCCLKCAEDSAYGGVSIELALEELYDVVDVSVMKDRSVLKKKLKDRRGLSAGGGHGQGHGEGRGGGRRWREPARRAEGLHLHRRQRRVLRRAGVRLHGDEEGRASSPHVREPPESLRPRARGGCAEREADADHPGALRLQERRGL
ncbi:unnamed protein product [Prorocentrum cordatum]|uniref:peptidylprolyl isomerase n=1 Tax=Prorocentrum cordatum TaxID=2364126 RepID=A0ABN9RKP4_9DINO|nr:unnamed protein product [Polarella glacialis]